MKKKLNYKFIIFRTFGYSLIIGAVGYVMLSFAPIVNAELRYQWEQSSGITYSVGETKNLAETKNTNKSPSESSYFSTIRNQKTAEPIKITPQSKDFGIVIEKLGINAPIVEDVDSSSYEEYTEALRYGVAHAKGTSVPGEPGNVYVHGHSSLSFWQLGSYATVFTLLNKLEKGDRIVTFYEGDRFDYEVIKIETFPGYDITPLTRNYEESVLTLQTCDPPGTTLNRLIVTAKLVNAPN